jgi:hypothetical protein
MLPHTQQAAAGLPTGVEGLETLPVARGQARG